MEMGQKENAGACFKVELQKFSEKKKREREKEKRSED